MQATRERSLLTPIIVAALMAGISAFLPGCATFAENSVGNHPDHMPSNGLHLALKPASGDRHVAGAPLVFEVTLTNTGSEPINLPKQPYLCLKWRYPNGLVDSTIPPDDVHVVADTDIVTIEPGKSFHMQKRVKTSHIPYQKRRLGIIEFRAAYVSDLNPKSARLPLWDGASVSNTYGVVLAASNQ